MSDVMKKTNRICPSDNARIMLDQLVFYRHLEYLFEFRNTLNFQCDSHCIWGGSLAIAAFNGTITDMAQRPEPIWTANILLTCSHSTQEFIDCKQNKRNLCFVLDQFFVVRTILCMRLFKLETNNNLFVRYTSLDLCSHK